MDQLFECGMGVLVILTQLYATKQFFKMADEMLNEINASKNTTCN